MRFKHFIKLTEEGGNGDNGLLGFPVASSVKKPSDGQPFKNLLGPVSGQTPRGGSGGGGGGGGGAAGPMGAKPMFMKKMKKMKKP